MGGKVEDDLVVGLALGLMDCERISQLDRELRGPPNIRCDSDQLMSSLVICHIIAIGS